MEFQVRNARSDGEWQQACSLLHQVYVNGGYTTDQQAAAFMVRERFENQCETIVAVHDDGRVWGAVLFLNEASSIRQLAQAGEREFRLLGVAETARGQGVGQSLVQACIDRAHAAGAASLVLWTQPKMLAAQRLYERLGFERWPSRDQADERGFTRLVYVRNCLNQRC